MMCREKSSLPTERAGEGVESRPELYPPSEMGDRGRGAAEEDATADVDTVFTESGEVGAEEALVCPDPR